MTKVALIADSHFGFKKGDSKMSGYISRFYKDIFFPAIDERNVKHVIHLGDLFDNRMEIATHVFDQVLADFVNPCLERNLQVHEIIGNHDTRYKNTNSINTPEILLGDKISGNKGKRIFNLIVNEFEVVKIGSLNIGLVPWITPENETDILNSLETTTATVIMGHFEIAGAKMDRTQVAKHGLSSTIFNRFDRVFSGHFHHNSKYGNIEYLGSPYEFTWIDCEDPKGFHIFDTETLELEFIRNPYTMFNKIVFDGQTDVPDMDNLKDSYVRVIVENNENPALLNNFVNSLSDFAQDVKTIENPSVLNTAENTPVEMNIEVEDTMDIIKIYLDSIAQPEIAELAKEHVADLYRRAIL